LKSNENAYLKYFEESQIKHFDSTHFLLKCIPGDYLMKLVERRPRVCKAVIKSKGGYFEESQIYLFNISLGLLHDSICVISLF
jgi:hypothetical protein